MQYLYVAGSGRERNTQATVTDRDRDWAELERSKGGREGEREERVETERKSFEDSTSRERQLG